MVWQNIDIQEDPREVPIPPSPSTTANSRRFFPNHATMFSGIPPQVTPISAVQPDEHSQHSQEDSIRSEEDVNDDTPIAPGVAHVPQNHSSHTSQGSSDKKLCTIIAIPPSIPGILDWLIKNFNEQLKTNLETLEFLVRDCLEVKTAYQFADYGDAEPEAFYAILGRHLYTKYKELLEELHIIMAYSYKQTYLDRKWGLYWSYEAYIDLRFQIKHTMGPTYFPNGSTIGVQQFTRLSKFSKHSASPPAYAPVAAATDASHHPTPHSTHSYHSTSPTMIDESGLPYSPDFKGVVQLVPNKQSHVKPVAKG